MPDREKLAAILRKTEINKINGHSVLAEVCFTQNVFERMADHLIANGVTVQEWISVKDRLPEYEKPVMGWDAEMCDMGIVNFIYGQFFDILDMSETNVTHWMPLPEPPKEGE